MLTISLHHVNTTAGNIIIFGTITTSAFCKQYEVVIYLFKLETNQNVVAIFALMRDVTYPRLHSHKKVSQMLVVPLRPPVQICKIKKKRNGWKRNCL